MFFNILRVSLLMLSVSISSTESSPLSFEENTNNESTFREDYKYVAETNTYYKEHKNVKTWSEAVAICKAEEGAQLATPLTKKEAQVLKKLILDNTWLGISDKLAEGYFKTVNGTSVNDIYVNWRSGEPNDADDGEDCVVMYKDGIYNDDKCDKLFRFVCTKHQSDVQPYTACETTDQEYILAAVVDRCYKLHTNPKNWHEAYEECLHEKAYLAIINSDAEAEVLVEKIQTQPEKDLRGNMNMKNFFLGFSDVLVSGEFLTINGETLDAAGYKAWAEDQPIISRDKKNCGGMSRDGKLHVVDCDVNTFFFCEKKLISDISPQIIVPRFGE